MKRDSFSVRAAAVSIVYGWLGLLAFALAFTSVHSKPKTDPAPAHKVSVASAPANRH